MNFRTSCLLRPAKVSYRNFAAFPFLRLAFRVETLSSPAFFSGGAGGKRCRYENASNAGGDDQSSGVVEIGVLCGREEVGNTVDVASRIDVLLHQLYVATRQTEIESPLITNGEEELGLHGEIVGRCRENVDREGKRAVLQ